MFRATLGRCSEEEPLRSLPPPSLLRTLRPARTPPTSPGLLHCTAVSHRPCSWLRTLPGLRSFVAHHAQRSLLRLRLESWKDNFASHVHYSTRCLPTHLRYARLRSLSLLRHRHNPPHTPCLCSSLLAWLRHKALPCSSHRRSPQSLPRSPSPHQHRASRACH